MPYSNIVFVKLFLELFDEDDRFLYQLIERQQLLYIKMLYLAGRQKNKISKNALLIIQKINYQGTTQELIDDIKNIKKIFKNFQETKYFYTFTKFDELHNQIRIGIAQGKPQFSPRACPDKDKDKDKEEDKEQPSAVKTALEKVYNSGFNVYALINKIKKQLHQSSDFQFPEEVLLAVCESYWREKDNIKEEWPWFTKVLERESSNYFAEKNIAEHNLLKQQGALSLKQILEQIAK